jgi:hypothetical protein
MHRHVYVHYGFTFCLNNMTLNTAHRVHSIAIVLAQLRIVTSFGATVAVQNLKMSAWWEAYKGMTFTASVITISWLISNIFCCECTDRSTKRHAHVRLHILTETESSYQPSAWLRPLVTGLLPRRPGFSPRPVYILRVVVSKVAPKWHQDRFFCKYFSVRFGVSFH